MNRQLRIVVTVGVGIAVDGQIWSTREEIHGFQFGVVHCDFLAIWTVAD